MRLSLARNLLVGAVFLLASPPRLQADTYQWFVGPDGDVAYSAILSDKNGGTGVGLIEAYDLDAAADSHLANIGTRGFVQAGDNVMIGGFIVAGGGAGNSTVVVRAIGPSLGTAGVANPLQDLQEMAIADDGLAPSDDRESAIEATLAPGAYTAIVRRLNNTTGLALVEAYNLQ